MATVLCMQKTDDWRCPSQIISPSSLCTRLSQTKAKQETKFPDFSVMSQQTFSTPIYLHTMTGLGSWPGEATFQHPLALGQPPAPRLLSKTEGPLFGPWTRYAWLLRKEHNIPSARHVGQRKCAEHGPQLLPNKHLADRLYDLAIWLETARRSDFTKKNNQAWPWS